MHLLWLLLAAAPVSVSGTVTFSGPAVTRTLSVTQDQTACGGSVPDESLEVGPKGELEGVVVSLEDAPAAPAHAPAQVTLDQRGCRFVPHVLAAEVGATLLATNSDPVLHTVRARGPGQPSAFSVAMPFEGASRSITLKKPGLLEVTCAAGHGWMHAFVQTLGHPYFAVTGADGRFNLPPVPPGHYTLLAWHETLGVRRVPVVADGHAVHVEFSPEKPR